MKRQPPGHPRNSTAYKRQRREFILRASPYCHVCGGSVDKRLPGTDPMGPTVDHLQPVSLGGAFFELSNWALAHRSCNGSKYNRGVRPEPRSPNA